MTGWNFEASAQVAQSQQEKWRIVERIWLKVSDSETNHIMVIELIAIEFRNP